jgi:hypothetical protein
MAIDSIGSIEEAIVEKVRALPAERRQQVLDFIEFLEHKAAQQIPRQSAEGLWAGLDVQITEEDIAAARHEMWDSFPRGLPDQD